MEKEARDRKRRRKKTRKHRENISKAKKGVKFTEEHKRNLSKAKRKWRKKCAMPFCNETTKAGTLCEKCKYEKYQKLNEYKECAVEGCDRPYYGGGYCEKHYREFTTNPRKCSVDDCERTHYAKGYCELHYRRMLHHGTTRLVKSLDGVF